MGKWTIPLEKIREETVQTCGGKASVLGTLQRAGLKVPSGVCIPVSAYNTYLDKTGLRGRILLELSRKPFEEMRWEEIWDLSEKIKYMFMQTSLPRNMRKELEEELSEYFSIKAVAVRSSAPGEDTKKTSFAGVHASYVNIYGINEILKHLRLVWASLWSDVALLYQNEMGLEIFSSSMAVLIQEIIIGKVSGVAFGSSPEKDTETVIEAVYGLNKGLVDGIVEPDRWILSRQSGELLTYIQAKKEKAVFATENRTELKTLPEVFQKTPPLSLEKVARIFELTKKVENLLGSPQDIEWTFKGSELYLLQARPISTLEKEDKEEKRRWYLNLRRSFENLKELRKVIEEKFIPAMQVEAKELQKEKLTEFSDFALTKEMDKRAKVYKKWHDIYWDEFIPFAHGARLFGKVYNETVNPQDPYEFLDLLSGTEMLSLERNRKLQEIIKKIRKNPEFLNLLLKQDRAGKTRSGDKGEPRNKENDKNKNEDENTGKTREIRSSQKGENKLKITVRPDIEECKSNIKPVETKTWFENELNSFLSEYGGNYSESSETENGIYHLVLEMVLHPEIEGKIGVNQGLHLEEKYFSSFKEENQQFAAELLELGRASYRLRDDDNIYLGKIEAELKRVFFEGKRRLMERGLKEIEFIKIENFYKPEYRQELIKSLQDPAYTPEWKTPSKESE